MENTDKIIFIGFNHDASCITISSEKESENQPSFRVIQTDPLKYCFQRGNV